MPRTRQTLSGHPGQPVPEIPNQMYGASGEQQQLAKQMPSPDAHVPVATVATGTAVGPVVPRPGEMHASALDAAAGIRAGVLRQPTASPREPVTAGLSIGPGPGPEMMPVAPTSPVGEQLRRLSIDTGNPMWAELARRAGV